MKWPYGTFKMKWNDSMNEPEVDQTEIGDFQVTWNPDDERFYVSKRSHEPERAGDTYPWDVLGTYKGTQKGYENAVQRMKQEVRAATGVD